MAGRLGMGVSVGPRLCIEPPDEEQLGIVTLSNLMPVDQGGIVTLKGKSLSTAAQSFISVMRDTLALDARFHGHDGGG